MSTFLNTISAGVRNWWLFAIKGLLMIIAGIAIFSRPAEGYLGLSILFSMVMLGSGLSKIFFSISNTDILKGWGWTLASGIFDLTIGIFLLVYPQVTMATLPYILGFWLLFAALYFFGAAFDLNSLGLPDWGWLLFGGILTMASAFIILNYTVAGIVSIIAWSGIAFLVAGIFNIVLAFKLKSVKKTAVEVKKSLQYV